ncbi:glycosyltransferase family 4 protein [Leptolyngbya sp. FACHB-541]|uniref:glycosyltransferase family 4 protein n=1 Tax=Leptolyngbya sp. FACHB-541 TaxID=2692810 RepID=UPI001683E97F|nr:glycosyltransferase family 1 protein [Leptolyngbya sp. FACHB-541]MBD2000699.1 glycosyltransferase family 4 protein [Leptolyngbya sp. FACHB-541]
MSHQLLVNLAFLLSRPTGTSTYALNLLSHLKLLNPLLLTAQTVEGQECYPIPAGQTAEQGFRGHLKRLIWTQQQLPKIYQEWRSPLIFSPIPEAPLFTNCRFVVTVHDLIPIRFPKRFSPLIPYYRYYVPQVLQQAQHLICDSVATAEDLTHFFQIPAKKITPILLAHNAEHFRFLDLPTRNYFLYLGRSDSYKNLQRLIAAFAALPTCKDYELWLAGPTDKRYTPQLIAQIDQLNLSAQVKFLNYVDYAELPKVINQAIALVFPSLWEGFGLPVLEAMACGTPVITSNVSSLPEVAGDAAILVNPYEVAEITEAMQTVASDAGVRSQLRSAGLARASQFSWEKTGQRTAEVLQQFC